LQVFMYIAITYSSISSLIGSMLQVKKISLHVLMADVLKA
jgi:hypothetical protein